MSGPGEEARRAVENFGTGDCVIRRSVALIRTGTLLVYNIIHLPRSMAETSFLRFTAKIPNFCHHRPVNIPVDMAVTNSSIVHLRGFFRQGLPKRIPLHLTI